MWGGLPASVSGVPWGPACYWNSLGVRLVVRLGVRLGVGALCGLRVVLLLRGRTEVDEWPVEHVLLRVRVRDGVRGWGWGWG